MTEGADCIELQLSRFMNIKNSMLIIRTSLKFCRHDLHIGTKRLNCLGMTMGRVRDEDPRP